MHPPHTHLEFLVLDICHWQGNHPIRHTHPIEAKCRAKLHIQWCMKAHVQNYAVALLLSQYECVYIYTTGYMHNNYHQLEGLPQHRLVLSFSTPLLRKVGPVLSHCQAPRHQLYQHYGPLQCGSPQEDHPARYLSMTMPC